MNLHIARNIVRYQFQGVDCYDDFCVPYLIDILGLSCCVLMKIMREAQHQMKQRHGLVQNIYLALLAVHPANADNRSTYNQNVERVSPYSPSVQRGSPYYNVAVGAVRVDDSNVSRGVEAMSP